MKKNYKIGITLAFVALALMAGGELLAQCPMCRMSAESNLKNGGMDGRGLNAGILYMFSLPYLLVAAIGIWWWRNRQAVASEPGNEQVNDRARLN
ncbi:MAG: hypothetical protein JNK89_05555 [Saprospiraceae bacterium]|nr:hypothetical protein [Saprospiraceae bacterium]